MMVYSTACCKRKRKNIALLKSIERYRSGRIMKIYEKSKMQKVQFRIFSGKYGLLKPEQKILWYDEKLSSKKMYEISEELKKQILEQKIDKIIFWGYNSNRYPNWAPYYKAMQLACRKAKIELHTKYL